MFTISLSRPVIIKLWMFTYLISIIHKLLTILQFLFLHDRQEEEKSWQIYSSKYNQPLSSTHLMAIAMEHISTTNIVNHYCSFDSVYIRLVFVCAQIISLNLVAMAKRCRHEFMSVLYAQTYEQFFISQGYTCESCSLKNWILWIKQI